VLLLPGQPPLLLPLRARLLQLLLVPFPLPGSHAVTLGVMVPLLLLLLGPVLLPKGLPWEARPSAAAGTEEPAGQAREETASSWKAMRAARYTSSNAVTTDTF
jgi:hypothetical protein